MRLLPGYITKFIPRPRGLSVGLEEILWWGMAALGLFLSAVILWDAYLFYGTFAGGGRQGEIIKPAAGISAREIDEVIQLLDERKKKFDSVLRE